MYDNNGYELKQSAGVPPLAMCGVEAKEPSLRNHIGDIAKLLLEASEHLSDAERKMYIPRPQPGCTEKNAPEGDSLEYYILRLKEIAQEVRIQTIEVNSRI